MRPELRKRIIAYNQAVAADAACAADMRAIAAAILSPVSMIGEVAMEVLIPLEIGRASCRERV